MNIDLTAIGKRIRDERIRKKWRIVELSEMTGLSTAHISCVERGASCFSVSSLTILADALNLSTDYILYGMNICRSGVFSELIQDCTQPEIDMIIESTYDLKSSLRKHFGKSGPSAESSAHPR